MRRARVSVVLCIALAMAGLGASTASAATLHLNGIGPLRLGMARSTALTTGWLSNRTPGCELAGPIRPIDYRLRGPKAPAGVVGNAEFQRGHLINMSFTRGVRTVTGVTVRSTTTAQMVARYRSAGYSASARYDSVFQVTFVTVARRGRTVIMGLARGSIVTQLGIPVPAGFTITTDACRAFMATGGEVEGLEEEIEEHIARLQERTGKRFGDPEDPLLVSVRSGGAVSMPGMMDTILNVGLNDESVEGLARSTGNEEFARDCYRRLIQMFGETVDDIPHESFSIDDSAIQLSRSSPSMSSSKSASIPVARSRLQIART